jgi:hypothetical protein
VTKLKFYARSVGEAILVGAIAISTATEDALASPISSSGSKQPQFRHQVLGVGLVRGSPVRENLALAIATTSPAPSALPSSPSVLTFQAWKTLRIEEARLVLERMMLETQIQQAQQGQGAASIDRAPGERQAVIRSNSPASLQTSLPQTPSQKIAPRTVPSAPTALNAQNGRLEQRSESKVEQARINLEIASELTITDYLQIYLSQYQSLETLRDVARRMAADEVADLLAAYQQQRAQNHGAITENSLGESRICAGATATKPAARP